MGARPLRTWEFRKVNDLSRKQTAEQYPAYFAEFSRKSSHQQAADLLGITVVELMDALKHAGLTDRLTAPTISTLTARP